MKWKLIYVLACLVVISCSKKEEAREYNSFAGETMGTYYKITLATSNTAEIQPDVDHLLSEVNMAASTYIDSSLISRFNRSTDTFWLGNSADDKRVGYFTSCFVIGKSIFKKSTGYYDPTVMPVVNYWGFGYTGKKPVTKTDSSSIRELVSYVGMDNLTMNNKDQDIYLVKTHPKNALDFSSVAKGLAIDEIAALLESKSIYDYFIDIGGEVRASGVNARNKVWTVGISTPDPDAAVNDIQNVVALDTTSIATSGNYRNFYEVDGVRYGHTINPKTGFPEQSELLSASIIAPSCAIADAWATACMAMGWNRAMPLIENEENLEALFIVNDNGQYKSIRTKGFDRADTTK